MNTTRKLFFVTAFSAAALSAQPAFFRVVNTANLQETFVIQLDDPTKIAQARAIVSGQETQNVHVMGTIVKAPVFYNAPFSFFLDPGSISFFSTAPATCNATATAVQQNLAAVGGSFLPNNIWCPFTSKVAVELAVPSAATSAISVVNSASFSAVALSPGSQATIFGTGLTSRQLTVIGNTLPGTL